MRGFAAGGLKFFCMCAARVQGMSDGVLRSCSRPGNKANDGFETMVISQHLHSVYTPRRGPLNPFLTTRLVCDLPLQGACVCNYTEVRLANKLSALAAHAHASNNVFCPRNDLFALAGRNTNPSPCPRVCEPLCVFKILLFFRRTIYGSSAGAHATSDTLMVPSKIVLVIASSKALEWAHKSLCLLNRPSDRRAAWLHCPTPYAHSLVFATCSNLRSRNPFLILQLPLWSWMTSDAGRLNMTR